MQTEADVKNVLQAFNIVGYVLKNSVFKPEQFDKITTTLSTVNEVIKELETHLASLQSATADAPSDAPAEKIEEQAAPVQEKRSKKK